jgi:hypothetical protein
MIFQNKLAEAFRSLNMSRPYYYPSRDPMATAICQIRNLAKKEYKRTREILSDPDHRFINPDLNWSHRSLDPRRQPMNIRLVVIPACDEHEGYCKTEVRLNWVCPVCGGPRGIIKTALSYDGSRRICVDGWTNNCGHVDKYPMVRKEAKENGLNNPLPIPAEGVSTLGAS